MCEMSCSPVVLVPHFSWVPRGFRPEILVAFSPYTPSKSVHWAVGVTSETQWKSHAHCPPKYWVHSIIGDSEQIQHEGLLLPKCGCWKSLQECHMKSLIYSLPFDTEEDFIAHIVQAAAAARHLSAHDNLCCIVVSFVLRSVAIYWSICSKLVRITFFRICHWFCLISSLSQTDFDGDWHCKDARLTYSSRTITLYFDPSHHLRKFGFFMPSIFWDLNFSLEINCPGGDFH